MKYDNMSKTIRIIYMFTANAVYFTGEAGYKKLVGSLNTIAKQYENTLYTSGSHYFGYNGQTETIASLSSWSCNTGASCQLSNAEAAGGGDTLYLDEYNRVVSVLGNAKAMQKTATTSSSYLAYWVASRSFVYDTTPYYDYRVRYISASGSVVGDEYLYYTGKSSGSSSYGHYLRPVVTLDQTLVYYGSGTAADPWKIYGTKIS